MARTKPWAQRRHSKGPKASPSDSPQADQRTPSPPPPRGVHLFQRVMSPQADTQSVPPTTARPPRWALIVGLQALSIQRSKIRGLRESLRRERLEKTMLRDALREAEARHAEPTSQPGPRSLLAVTSTREQVPSWQMAEVRQAAHRTPGLKAALALELDVLNWALGHGPPFPRRAFWGQALPCAVAMLRACGEAEELERVGGAVWRPTWQPPGEEAQLVQTLRHETRKLRDRVNSRLDKLHATIGMEMALRGAQGAGNMVQRRAAWLESLTLLLPPLPLSLCGRARGEGAGLLGLSAPAGAPLFCANDTAGVPAACGLRGRGGSRSGYAGAALHCPRRSAAGATPGGGQLGQLRGGRAHPLAAAWRPARAGRPWERGRG
eukprot:scaffold30564_cov58-Phaeocystis_antarctica.AAC.3